MEIEILKKNIDGIDIYILDQILKGRYQSGEKILDAGCGSGRNLKWFYNSGFETYGIDLSFEDIKNCKNKYSKQRDNFSQASVDLIPFETNSFDHVICNAVLHFAKDLNQYSKIFKELLRILKPQGSLFIRIASEFGIEKQIELIDKGVYKLPDGSTRFLLTSKILNEIINRNDIVLIEDVKTTLVQNKRSMTTLVIKKKG